MSTQRRLGTEKSAGAGDGRVVAGRADGEHVREPCRPDALGRQRAGRPARLARRSSSCRRPRRRARLARPRSGSPPRMPGCDPAAREREAEHAHALVGRPADRAVDRELVERPVRTRARDAGREQARVRRHPVDADAVAANRGDQPGGRGAVGAVRVQRVAPDEPARAGDAAREIGVLGVDPRVQDGHRDRMQGREDDRLADRPQVPLLLRERVRARAGGSGRRAERQQQDAAERERPPQPVATPPRARVLGSSLTRPWVAVVQHPSLGDVLRVRAESRSSRRRRSPVEVGGALWVRARAGGRGPAHRVASER